MLKAFAFAFLGGIAAQASGPLLDHLPLRITTNPDIVVMNNGQRLAKLFAALQPIATDGGPQAVEGYTKVTHDYGSVGYAQATIGNLEIAGAGDLQDGAALTGGIVVSGPGRVHHVAALSLTRPLRLSDYTGPIHVDVADYIAFDNGWSLRGTDEALWLCKGATCRPLGF